MNHLPLLTILKFIRGVHSPITAAVGARSFANATVVSLSNGLENHELNGLVDRYSKLRREDRLKIYKQHLEKGAPELALSWHNIESEVQKRTEKDVSQFSKAATPQQSIQRRLKRAISKFSPRRPSKKPFENVELLATTIRAPTERERKGKIRVKILTLMLRNMLCSSTSETATLLQDCYSSSIYSQICERLKIQWKTKGPESDAFLDVMSSAIRDELICRSRPVLVNEFADFQNPYMMKKCSMRRLLDERCTKNRLESSQVSKSLSQLYSLKKLRLQANSPPEWIEPLRAFRGDVAYSFDSRSRLEQKLSITEKILGALRDYSGDSGPILSALAKDQEMKAFSEHHPFRNHLGFVSSTPKDYVGGIKMGKPLNPSQTELGNLRYPTLQRVAHSLPDDPEYRKNTTHAIRILERSKNWNYPRKVEAINTLVDAWKNLGPSKKYKKAIDAALQQDRQINRSSSTLRSERRGGSKPLSYIKSLTTQKPLHTRRIKK